MRKEKREKRKEKREKLDERREMREDGREKTDRLGGPRAEVPTSNASATTEVIKRQGGKLDYGKQGPLRCNRVSHVSQHMPCSCIGHLFPPSSWMMGVALYGTSCQNCFIVVTTH